MKGDVRVRVGAIAGALVLVAIVVMTRSTPRVASPPAPSIALPPVSSAPAPSLGPTDELEQRLVAVTNGQRTRVGLRPLDREAGLSAAARRHSQDMLRRRFFAHVNPEGQTPADRVARIPGLAIRPVGENIWMWSGSSRPSADALVAQAVAEWMASPEHRANILMAGYTRLGVGAAVDASDVRLTELFVE
jgi:uncharacterized protein YkwD